jgi:hypothetical protein
MEEPKNINWRRWVDVGGRPVQTDIILSVKDAVDHVNSVLGDYKVHCFIKDEQSNFFKTCKEHIPEKHAILQVDFAQNYSAISQDEVQSAHWTHQQITLFTAVAWVREDICESIVVVSDDLKHDKVSVWVLLGLVIKFLKEKHQIKHAMIFSDGSAAQFKNCYTMANICFMEDDFGVTCDWAFFASSHGKGVVDALGGTLKRSVWRAVKARKVLVNDAITFHGVAKELCKGVNVLYCSSIEIREKSEFLEERWTNVIQLDKIQKKTYFPAIWALSSACLSFFL